MGSGAGSAPRILLVGDVSPGGPATGTQRRLTATARGLAEIGTVDYLQWGARPWRRRVDARSEFEPIPPFARHTLIRRYGLPDRLSPVHELVWSWWPAIPGSRPAAPFAVADAATPRRTTIDRFLRARAPYDLMWCFELTSAIAIDVAAGRTPVVVDVDAVPHLEDDADALPTTRTRLARRDREAWQAWIERLGRSVAAMTFSNPLEAAVFDLANAVVVPNGCTVPPYRGARDVGARPVLSFVGWMGYEPNADAARYLVREIVPALRATLDTEFEVRLIGSAPPEILDLAQDPNVTVTGYVDDLAAELDRADLIVVPVRRGAGTRIKAIEAFASQVPVVSTTFGALGIGAVDGTHLLLADDARSFARACGRALTEAELRKRLVKAAYALVSEHHDWAVIEVQVASIAAAAIRGGEAQRMPDNRNASR